MATAVKMESRSIDLISKQIYTCMSTLFFLISQKNKFARAAHTLFFKLAEKKTNLHMQHAFSLLLFCTTKTSNFLVTHYFYGAIVYVLTKDFVS